MESYIRKARAKRESSQQKLIQRMGVMSSNALMTATNASSIVVKTNESYFLFVVTCHTW